MKQVPKTIENQRKLDDSYIPKDSVDHEIVNDEKDDEFCCYYTNEKKPKIMITTRPKCSRFTTMNKSYSYTSYQTFHFISFTCFMIVENYIPS